MSIETIAATGTSLLPAAMGIGSTELGSVPLPAATGGSAFDALLTGLGTLNQELNTGERGLQTLATGGGLDNLHHALMGMERTRLALQLLLQVRSRALDAYQELTRMQI